MANKTKRTAKAAVDDFESVAKRLECDEDKERFEAALGKIAKPVPKVEAKGKKPGKNVQPK